MTLTKPMRDRINEILALREAHSDPGSPDYLKSRKSDHIGFCIDVFPKLAYEWKQDEEKKFDYQHKLTVSNRVLWETVRFIMTNGESGCRPILAKRWLEKCGVDDECYQDMPLPDDLLELCEGVS